MRMAASGACHTGIVCPLLNLNDIINGVDGGKKLRLTATIPFGSRTATNQTINGLISNNQTGSRRLCASFNSLTDAPMVRKIELKSRTPKIWKTINQGNCVQSRLSSQAFLLATIYAPHA